MAAKIDKAGRSSGPDVNTRRAKDERRAREQRLDEALAMSFPASDPIAVGKPTGPAVRARGGKTPAKAEGAAEFTVGLKAKGKVQHVVVEGEDALIAALKVKCEHPDAMIIYVRRRNRRGDARHPPFVDRP
jgi:hypothetical protein